MFKIKSKRYFASPFWHKVLTSAQLINPAKKTFHMLRWMQRVQAAPKSCTKSERIRNTGGQTWVVIKMKTSDETKFVPVKEKRLDERKRVGGGKQNLKYGNPNKK